MSAPKWQPIGTAPEGQHLVLYFPADERLRLGAMIRVDVHPVSYPRQPKYWSPLPEFEEGAPR